MAGPDSRFLVPPVYFLVALLLMGFFHRVAPWVQVLDVPYRYAGVVLMGLALCLIAWAAFLFLRAGTSIRPFLPSTALVLEGPYKFTRNPMYLGLTMLVTGVALFSNAVWMLVVLIPTVFVLQREVIAKEERYLEAKFGDEYRAYRSRVRRWL